jgi:hypothetical protein
VLADEEAINEDDEIEARIEARYNPASRTQPAHGQGGAS